MPKGDGTGPMGQGHATGRFGEKSKPGHIDGVGAGPEGDCVCPDCENIVPHQTGVPCNQVKCPKCYSDLKEENYKEEVNIDRCRECGGVWLDAGEMEVLVEREYGFISGFLKHLLD